MSAAALASRIELPTDRAWDAYEVAYFLGVSVAMVRKLEWAGRLPSFPRIGRRVTFDPKVVQAFREGRLKTQKGDR